MTVVEAIVSHLIVHTDMISVVLHVSYEITTHFNILIRFNKDGFLCALHT